MFSPYGSRSVLCYWLSDCLLLWLKPIWRGCHCRTVHCQCIIQWFSTLWKMSAPRPTGAAMPDYGYLVYDWRCNRRKSRKTSSDRIQCSDTDSDREIAGWSTPLTHHSQCSRIGALAVWSTGITHNNTVINHAAFFQIIDWYPNYRANAQSILTLVIQTESLTNSQPMFNCNLYHYYWHEYIYSCQ